MAVTQSERRRIALELLRLEQEQYERALMRMPQITGWSYAVVFRGTSSAASASVAVSERETGGLYEPRVFEDDTLTPGSYWWWVRIYDAADNLLSISPAASGTIV
nr:hypothetical protein [Novosphingobium silvae]